MDKRITVNFEGEDVEIVEGVREEEDVESWSGAVRECVRRYADLREERDELKTENERLHRERRQLLEEREEKQELVRYVETEMTAAERRRRASVVERAKWWLFGQDE